MNKNIQFANRSGFNLKFYKYDSTRAEHGYKADEPPLIVDFVNSCTLETTGDTVWATGGKGFKRLIGFDNPLEGTFNIETQITNTPVWAMIAGQDPANFDPKNIKFTNKTGKRKFYYVVECDTTFVDEDGINYVQEVTLHKCSVNRAFNATYTGDGDPQSITIALDLAENGADDLVTMSFEDNDKAPDITYPFAKTGATVNFSIDDVNKATFKIEDYIDENGAVGVTYALSKNNENVKVSSIVDKGFSVVGIADGDSVVTLQAIMGDKVRATVEINFTVTVIITPDFVIGPITTSPFSVADAGPLTGQFEGANDGSDITPNVNIEYGLDGLSDGDIYTRAFKIEQIAGTPGNVQLFAHDGDENYWDIANNMVSIAEQSESSPAMRNFAIRGGIDGYTGFWGRVVGNEYDSATTSTDLDVMLVAANEGVYLVTCDILKIEPTGYTVTGSTTVRVEVVT